MYKQIKKLSSRKMKSFFQGYTVSKKKELDFWLKAHADLLQLYYFLREVIWMQGVFFCLLVYNESPGRDGCLLIFKGPPSSRRPQKQEGQTQNKTWWRLGTNAKVKVIILRIMAITTPLFCTRHSDKYFSHTMLSPTQKALLSPLHRVRIWGSEGWPV